MTINSTAAILLAMYLAVAKKQNVSPKQVNGTVQNDILKEYIARGTVHLSGEVLAAPHHRHLRVLSARGAQLEHDFHQRVSHPGGGLHSRSGTRIHVWKRDHVRSGGGRSGPRRRRVCAAAVVLLQRPQRFSGRDREVPRRSPHVGEDRQGSFRGEESPIADAALSRADGGLIAHCPTARQQRRPRDDAGARGDSGRRPVAAYQFQRRSALSPHSRRRTSRAEDPADHRLRVGRREHGRSGRRLVRDRSADR